MAEGDFHAGVRAAIQDELSAVSEYAQLAQMAQQPAMKAIIMSIMGDEYGHARTFLAISELMRTGGIATE